MADDAVIILDPGQPAGHEQALDDGKKDFIGGNCTVSLMLMALGGSFNADLVEWATSMTYQALGAGAKNMRELLARWGVARQRRRPAGRSTSAILEIDRAVTDAAQRCRLPDRKLRCAAGGKPDPVDRCRAGQWPEQGGMEGFRRDQQDPGCGATTRCRSTAPA